MKYIDEYRDKNLVLKLAKAIAKASTKPVRLMEVCGGHTMAICKFGLPALLPPTVTLLSGPGCPVCVTDKRFIDYAIAYSRNPELMVATFGDLIRVPGSTSTLMQERAREADIRTVYSPLEALEIAKEHPSKQIVFLGIGFETTAPTTAAAIQEAAQRGIPNFFVHSSHKIMPPAMGALIDEGVKINGYICPGHVSVITGSHIYEPIAEKYKLGCVVSGFEPVDLLQSIYMLVKQWEAGMPHVEIQYSRAVRPEGNVKAQSLMAEVFEARDDGWRGLGILPKSGLGISQTYRAHDAESMISVEVEKTIETQGCICGEILKGLKTPQECPLFDKACTPSNPIGACMVSSEGACAAHWRYGRG
jgi:hydrogenase expression/formation protein HypD